MSFSWFITFQDVGNPTYQMPEAEEAHLSSIISTTPGLTKGLIYTPWAVDGLHYNDGPSPHLQLQLYFDDIETLESVVGATGHLQQLAEPTAFPSLAGARVTEQAMIARNYPVKKAPSTEHSFCTYLVHYPGPADDLNQWLRHYIDGHTPIMRRFPGIRGVEVCSRIDWCSSLPWVRVDYMQRNKVVFDDADALKAALNSPVMQEMRADSAKSPPFSGGNAHFPMRTVQISGDVG